MLKKRVVFLPEGMSEIQTHAVDNLVLPVQRRNPRRLQEITCRIRSSDNEAKDVSHERLAGFGFHLDVVLDQTRFPRVVEYVDVPKARDRV